MADERDDRDSSTSPQVPRPRLDDDRPSVTRREEGLDVTEPQSTKPEETSENDGVIDTVRL